MSEINLEWTAPGPVSEAFLQGREEVAIINGPIGSGKTTTCFMKAIRLAQAQRPTPGKGVRVKGDSRLRPLREFKLTVMRDDYRQLWRSTIPSWFSRFPREYGKWSGAVNAPAQHELDFALPDGTLARLTVDFVALGDNDIEDFMRGYEPTAFYLNELDLLHPDVLKHALLRIGRFPKDPAGRPIPSWTGVIADCNAPVIDSWLYEIFLAKPESYGLYRLPGGFDPGAENRQNLGAGYYERQLRLLTDAYLVRRMVHNQPAPSRAGKPVHEEFNDLVHVAPGEMAAIDGLPLILGFDAGLDPAMALFQKLGNGRWNCLDELAAGHGTGALRFAGMVNELLMDRYPGWHRIPTAHEREWGWAPRHGLDRPNIRAWCDPAATYGGDANSAAEADRTWCELVSYHTGIRIAPAPTNNTTDRRAALKRVLELMPDGRPAFQLSPRCKMLRAGLAGQFRYRRMQLAREERYTDEVDKNAHSHVCEAAEYALLGGGELAEVHERRQRGWDARNLPRTTGSSEEGWSL